MKDNKGIQGWIRDLIEHQVKRKRDERSVLDETNSCPSCHRRLTAHELEATFYTCPHCEHHFRLTAWERIRITADEGVFQELSADIETANPLEFPDYEKKLEAAAQKTGITEAVVTGLCKVDGHEVVLAVMDFRFIGGSMGSVVGEKITRGIERAIQNLTPLIIVSCSGGARMQEGVLSLMQMAKTVAALQRLAEKKQPFISILTDPTTGGVSASFAMLGDITIAEPGATIGFAGPRVIEQTIKQKLPDGFQTAEFLLEHGLIDHVVHRRDMRATLNKILCLLKNTPIAPSAV